MKAFLFMALIIVFCLSFMGCAHYGYHVDKKAVAASGGDTEEIIMISAHGGDTGSGVVVRLMTSPKHPRR
ncbi:MAG: hypothetical protein R3F48_14235 [Candidatus Zixiibacteriota bacterium]